MNFDIAWHDRLGSTNAYLKDQLTRGFNIPEGTVLATREQTAGRGRSNRKWLTAPNTNLCFSLYIETACSLMEVPSLTMAVALGIAEFLNSKRIPAAPKWPNDVLVGNKKICGILSERIDCPSKSGIIIGIGLNVNMSTEEATRIDRPATSMLMESNQAADLEQTLAQLLLPLDPWIETWKRDGFSSFKKTWTEKAGPIGKPLTVHDGIIKKTGTLAGFGNHGELLLQTASGLETVWSGDVS